MVIRIGVPYWMDDGIAACPVELDGFFENGKEELTDTRGIDLLQALSMAANVDTTMLEYLRRKYDFYWPSVEPYFDD